MACAVMLGSLVSSGCIIPDAPEYGAARQTPIFIDPNSIHPNPGSILRLREDDPNPIKFQMSIRSEDADEGLYVALYLDYKHEHGNRLDDQPIDPGTFDKLKPITEVLAPTDSRVSVGCHTFTLMVMHERFWSREHRQPIGAPPDLASLTWFATKNDDGDQLVAECPNGLTEAASPSTNVQ